MRSRSEKKIINLIREEYSGQIYSTLLEMEVIASGGKLLVGAGLEVTHAETGEKFTVQSVQQDGDKVTFSLIAPEKASVPISDTTPTVMVPPSRIVSKSDFEKNYRI